MSWLISRHLVFLFGHNSTCLLVILIVKKAPNLSGSCSDLFQTHEHTVMVCVCVCVLCSSSRSHRDVLNLEREITALLRLCRADSSPAVCAPRISSLSL